jgi:hypothetical protein
MSDKDDDHGDDFKDCNIIRFQIQKNAAEVQSQQEQERSNLEKLPKAEFETNPEKPSIAEMTGYIPDESEVENGNKTGIEEIEASEACLVTTKGNIWHIWDRTGAKTVIVAGLTLTGVSTFGLSGRYLTTIFNNKDKPQEVAQISTKPVESDDKEDVGALKTKLAVGSQLTALEKLNSKILTPTPTAIATSVPITKPTTEPRTVTVTPQSVPKVITVTAEPTTVSRYETVVKPKRPIPPPSPKPQTQVIKVQRQPLATQPINSPTPSNPNQNKGVSKTEAHKSDVQVIGSIPSTSKGLIIGTHATAKLETTIVWTGVGAGSSPQNSYTTKGIKHKQQQNPITYPIKLTQPLKNADGIIVLPKNSLLITQVKSVTPEGWINLSVVSIVANFSSGTLEKVVPEGAILVQARDGSPLKANIKALPQSKDNAETIALSGISRISRLPVRHGIDPIHNESARGLNNQPRITSKPKQPLFQFRTFTLEKDARLQVYVNQSFSL